MFKLIQNTPTGGDCTCGYVVELDHEYTVREFITEVLTLRNNEWGGITIRDNDSITGVCTYSHGALENEELQLPDGILNNPIIWATSSGGWSRMDYIIKT